MKTIAITKARRDLYNIVDETIANSMPVQILGRSGGAVLVSADDWQALQETIYLLSIKGFAESLKNADDGEWLTEDEVEW